MGPGLYQFRGVIGWVVGLAKWPLLVDSRVQPRGMLTATCATLSLLRLVLVWTFGHPPEDMACVCYARRRLAEHAGGRPEVSVAAGLLLLWMTTSG